MGRSLREELRYADQGQAEQYGERLVVRLQLPPELAGEIIEEARANLEGLRASLEAPN